MLLEINPLKNDNKFLFDSGIRSKILLTLEMVMNYENLILLFTQQKRKMQLKQQRIIHKSNL